MSEFEKVSARRKELQKEREVPEWYTTQGLMMFERKYSYQNETVKGAFERISNTLCNHYPDIELARSKFFEIMWKGFLGPATPVMCNTGTNRGLVVSCSGGTMGDSIFDFYKTHLENAVLNKLGFGTSSYIGSIRGRGAPISSGGEAEGIVPQLETAIAVMNKVSQGNNRRGQWAGYLEIDHPDFYEVSDFIKKNPADTNIGYMYSDKVIDALTNNDEEMVGRWCRHLAGRKRNGKGYFWKQDLANRLAPEEIKNCGITIKASQLCNEISLPQDENHTYTCVLSSLNLAKWDYFDDDTIFWATIFLDCVVSEFLQQAEGIEGLERALRFTKKARAIGLGTMGLATYFQKKNLPFESLHAHILNNNIYSKINDETIKASRHLAELLGEPLWCKGYGTRFITRMAIAPNMSSAILCGSVSQGIESFVANAFTQQTAAGEMVRMNPEFVELAKSKGEFSLELMEDLAKNWSGSVQHLDWLSEHEKSVFKTAFEINQFTVLRLASMRQRRIDQGQSLNLYFSSDATEEYIAEVHKEFLLDPYLKGLYYLRSERGIKASKGECTACEG